MKKIIPVLLFLLNYLSVLYSQQLKKVDESKSPLKININVPLDNQYKVSASSFTESFESTTFPPTGWTILNGDGGSGWSRQTSGSPLPGWTSGTISVPSGGGTAVAYCTWNSVTLFNNQSLITPLIQDIQSSDTLFFWMRNQIDVADSIYIHYSIDGSNWNSLGHVYYPNQDGTDWGKWYVPIGKSIPSGSDVFIAIQEFVNDNATAGGAVSLDLFQIKGTEAVSAPTVTTNGPTNISSNSATLNGTVNPNNSSTSVIFEYGTSAAYGSTINAAQNPVTGSSAVNVSANLTGLQSNTTYHYRVKGTSNGGVNNGADITFTTYPASITLTKTFTFTDLTQSSYRMIGLPGNNNIPINTVIDGVQKKDWDAFYDDGSDPINLTEFNGQALFSFTPGKGFWILSKNPINIPSQDVNSVNLTGISFPIPLHNGWNIISNPFEKAVSVADIKTANGLGQNSNFFDFKGSFTSNGASTLNPYEGYYFFNDGTHSSLNIPYPFTISTGKIKADKINKFYPADYLKLALMQNNIEKSFIIAGFNSEAEKAYDELDGLAPPDYFENIRINIEDQEIPFSYKQLFVDYKPIINEGQSFNIKIKNTTKHTVKLITDGIENFSNYEVYLLDNNLNKFYNLKEKNEIILSPLHEKYDFQLLVGDKKYIDNIKKGNIPTEYEIYQNYPNPFNPVTLIKYQIPVNNNFVEIKIYNILGKEVKTLVNEVQNSGIHEVEFNASNLSSGVYFYTLKAGSYSATKKMIFMK